MQRHFLVFVSLLLPLVFSLLYAFACDQQREHGAPASRPAALRAAPAGAAAPAPAASESAERVARGRYLVEHVAVCGTCHSPQRPDGSFDRARWLGGMDCYVDFAPDDPDVGCLSTRNLTNHETGLKNRS